MNQPKSQNQIKNEDHDQERRDPCHSDIPEWLQEFGENLVDERVPEHRDSHASSHHEPSLEPAMREVRIWVNTVFLLTSRKIEIARSARRPKSQGPRAEDALAQWYLEQKILVTWFQQITKFSVKDVNLETIIDTLSWYNSMNSILAVQNQLTQVPGADKEA